MSLIPPSVREALQADTSLWPGQPSERLEHHFGTWPQDVREAWLSALVDPERNGWSRAAAWSLAHAATADVQVRGLATDETIELHDARQERFVLAPIGFRLAPDAWGSRPDLERLLAGLDAAVGRRRYVLSIRRPVPAGLDVDPICHLVRLWLVEIDRGERHERNAVYESEDKTVAFEITLAEIASERGGRIGTFAPLVASERLTAVEQQIVEIVSRTEESIGQIPLLVALAADQPWRISRGHVQERLLGTPERIFVEGDGAYEAEFTTSSRWSLFSDPAYRSIAALWWFDPIRPASEPADPLSFRAITYENPWASTRLSLGGAGERFVLASEPDGLRRAVLRWRSEP